MITSDEARARFREMAAAGGPFLDLGLGAILIGAEEEEGVDVDGVLHDLDHLAESLEATTREGSDLQRVAHLCEGLFKRAGFRGDSDHYSDPRNSFLHQVVRRRVGIPITLSIVLIETARRLGMGLHPVGFPTHFLVGIDGRHDLFIDPFHEGRILTVAECEALLHVRTGGALAFHREYLAPTATPDVLARVLRNLKAQFARDESFEDALRASERILLLTPDDIVEVRDRGLLLLRLSHHERALEDLRRYLETAHAPTDRAWIEQLIEEAVRGK